MQFKNLANKQSRGGLQDTIYYDPFSISQNSLKSTLDWILIFPRKIIGELVYGLRKCQRCKVITGVQVRCRVKFIMISGNSWDSKSDHYKLYCAFFTCFLSPNLKQKYYTVKFTEWTQPDVYRITLIYGVWRQLNISSSCAGGLQVVDCLTWDILGSMVAVWNRTGICRTRVPIVEGEIFTWYAWMVIDVRGTLR